MARRPRIDAVGILYHVITRGNNRQALFRTDGDRERYLVILAEAQRRFLMRIYGYALMPNHVHLLLELTAGKLAKCLQVIQQRYAQYFNRKYRRVGHLYQGRYRAIVCERDRYLVALVRYLHLNPVRAGLVRDPAAYPWTSHRTYLGRAASPVAVTTTPILGTFSGDIIRARKAYARFVAEAVGTGHAQEFYAVQEQQILGSEQFAEQVSLPRGGFGRKARQRELELEELLERVSRVTQVPPALITGRKRTPDVYRARALLCYAAVTLAHVSIGRVASAIGRDPSNVTRAIAWVERIDPGERDRFLRQMSGGE